MLLVKVSVKILHLFRLILFELSKDLKKKSSEDSDIFQMCIFKPHIFTLDKAEGYVYDHIIHTCILPTSLMGLRDGLHPFIPTSTLHLPIDAALESLQFLRCTSSLVTQLLCQLQKPLLINTESNSLEAECVVYVTPISATPRRDSLYC